MERISQICESLLEENIPLPKNAKLRDRDLTRIRLGFFAGMYFMEEYLKPGH
jgi:hypothetical protein